MSLERTTELLRNLSESRSVEIKRWIDPTSAEGKAKIVKGVFALYNFNGGYFVVGFDDASLTPDLARAPNNVRSVFHHDAIQGLISHYASEHFEVALTYPDLDGQEYPVIAVPAGVRSPVAAKRDLQDPKDKQKMLIGCNDIYFRTLNSNNSVSSAKIPYKDLPELMRICFDNHEADIGRFLRRHLSGINPETVKTLLEFATSIAVTGGSDQSKASLFRENDILQLLTSGNERYNELVHGRLHKVPTFGSVEIGLIVDGKVPKAHANADFLRLLDASNPNLTGWPIWLNSQGFRQPEDHPFVFNDAWEALIANLDSDWGGRHLEFMRKDPRGRFYLKRALQDDLALSERAPPPNTQLDFGLSILRVAEAIAVGLAFARALACNEETTTLEFAFRWHGLKGRKLTSWAQPDRYLSSHPVAVQNEIVCRVTVPLETPLDAVHAFTQKVIDPLFALFGGFTISPKVTEDLVQKLITRRL